MVVVVFADAGVVDADGGRRHLGLGGQRGDLRNGAHGGGLAHTEATGHDDLYRYRSLLLLIGAHARGANDALVRRLIEVHGSLA